MVNSGSFESDVDQNEKGKFTQPRRIAESPHSVSSGPIVSGSSCENDFTTQTADSLPVSQAIEPTATKTEYKCNMSSLPLRSSDILPSKCISNNTIANRKTKEVFEARVTLIGDNECSKPSENDNEYVLAEKCNLQNKLVDKADEIKTTVSLCCSVPLEKVQNVLMTYRSTSINESNPNTPSKKQIVKKDMCLYCDRTFPTPNLKQKHVERYHSLKYNRRLSARRQTSKSLSTACFFCDKLNDGEYNLRQLFEHLVTEHPKKYFGCLDCEVRFPNVQIFKNHIITFHENKKEALSKHHSIEIVLSDEKRDVLENVETENPAKSEDCKSELKNNVKTNNPLPLIKNEETTKRIKNGYKFKNSVLSEDKKIEDEKGKILLTPPVALEQTSLNPDHTQNNISTKEKRINLVKELRSKKISVISSKIVAKQCFRITRQQNKKQIEDNKITKKPKPTKNKNDGRTAVSTNYISFQNRPYSAYELAFRIKKITDHSIDNIRISSLTFDDVFDKAFFNKVKCNIQENLSNFIDGKLFKSIESENRISSFQKSKDFQTDETKPPEACSSSTFSTSGCLLTDTHLGEDAELPVDTNTKAKKKTVKNDEVHYKYFTRRKYQAIILENKKQRDLSKLDMWTQLAVKNRQQKILCDQKSDKEMIEYKKSNEYKVKMQIEELNTILDKRGPFEDLKEEALRTVTMEKLNGIEADINAENYLDVSIILNDLLDNLFSKNFSSSVLENKSTNQRTSLNNCQGNLEVNEEFPSMLNLCRVATNTVTTKSEDDIRDTALVEMTGEWTRTKLYVCGACGTKVPNAKSLVEHKNLFHEHVWCQHFELVGNQGELYKHLSIPGLGKVGEIETSGSKIWRRSDSRVCTKCNKQFNCLGDLHRHVLECGGDWSWVLARKKYKYRHYGSKARKKRRGLLKYLQALRHRKLNKSKEKGKPAKKFDGPRPKPSDADTIQRMLANLPAKRRTRKIICLKDGFHRAVKNMNLTKISKNNQVNQNKKQLKKNKNLKSTRRLLRSNSNVSFENTLNLIMPKLKKNKKEITVTNLNQNSRKSKNMFVKKKKITKSKAKLGNIPEKVVMDSNLTENKNEKEVIHKGRTLRKKNLDNKLEKVLHSKPLKKSKNLKSNVATKKTDYNNFLTNGNNKNVNKKERNLKEIFQNDDNIKKPKSKITKSIKVKSFQKETVQESLDKHLSLNDSNIDTSKKKRKKTNNINNKTLVTMKNNGVKKMKTKNQGKNIKEQKKKKVITKNLKVRLRKRKPFPFENQITNIIQVDGSSQNNPTKNKNSRKEFNNSKKSVEKIDIKKPFLSQEDNMPIIINPETESQESINLTKPVMTELTEPPFLTPIDKVSECNPSELNKTNQSLNTNGVENKCLSNGSNIKPKGKKKLKGLNDCIAMLTSKLQGKNISCLHSSESNHDDIKPDKTIFTLAKEENVTIPCNNTAMGNPELNLALPKTEQIESNCKKSNILDKITYITSSNVLEKVDNNSLGNKIVTESTANETSLKFSIVTHSKPVDQNQATLVKEPSNTMEDTSEDDFTLEDHIPIKHIFRKQIELRDVKTNCGKNNTLTENEKHKTEISFKTCKSKKPKIKKPKEHAKKPENNPKRVFEKYVYKKEVKENTANKNEEGSFFNISILSKPVTHAKPRELNTSGKDKRSKSPLKIIVNPKKVNRENEIKPVIIDETNSGDSEDDNVPLVQFIKKANDYAEPELVLAQSNDIVQQNEDNLEMPVLLPEVFVEETKNHIAHKIDIKNNHSVKIPVKHKNSKYKKKKNQHIKKKKAKSKVKIDTTKQNNNLDLTVTTMKDDKVKEFIAEETNDLKTNELSHNNSCESITSKNLESESILSFSEQSAVLCDTTVTEDVTTETNRNEIISVLHQKEEINSNDQNSIENENENSRNNKENENTQTIKNNNQTENIKRSTKRNIKSHKRKSKTIKSQAVIDKNLTNVYCDICNKTFTRTENLLKHKRTLTHIAKLSEIEAQEAAEKIAEHSITEETQNSQVSKLSTVQDEFSDLDNDSNDKYLSSLSRFPLTTSSQNGLKLVDIISDVLSKPIENTFTNKHSSFSDLILPPSNYNVKHCSSLEERNGFESDKLLLYSDHHLISHISTAADVIVEKQISLLENMIEDNHNNMKRSEKISVSSNHSTNEEYSRQSNSSEFSIGNSRTEDCNDITFSHNTNIITNLIKPTLDGDHLIRSAQYEAISEDSSSSHFQIEEQKSRKILNRDEELFLECCSLLKSSSEVSDFCKKPPRPLPFLNGFNLKSFDDLDWLQNKSIGIKKFNDFESASSNFTSEDSHMNTSVGDQFYHNLPYSNSDASLNYNLNLKTMFARNGSETVFSQPPIFEDISRESEDTPARFLGSCLKSSPLNLVIDQYDKASDCVSPNVESAQIPEDQNEAIEEISEVASDAGNSNEIIEDINEMCEDIDEQVAAVETNVSLKEEESIVEIQSAREEEEVFDMRPAREEEEVFDMRPAREEEEVFDMRPAREEEEVLDMRPAREDEEEVLDMRPAREEEEEEEEEVVDMRPTREDGVLDMRPTREVEVLDLRSAREVLHMKPARGGILDIRPATEEEVLDLSPAREEEVPNLRSARDEEKFLDIRPATLENFTIKQPVPKMIQPQITDYATVKNKLENQNTFVEEESAKEFEELKVSIPKDGLNMKKILNCSPASKWLEIKAFEKFIHPNKKVPKRSSHNKLGYKGNKLGFKETKKRHLTNTKSRKTKPDNFEKKCHDIYDFEETQDSVDVFNSNSDNFPIYRSFRNKISEDSESENKSGNVGGNDEELVDELCASKKINGVKSITKKKCMIMGRIFKNALKSKMADEIKNIPTIDNKKSVEDYVMSCPPVSIQNSNCNKEHRLTEEEMNMIFDSLLNEGNSVQKKCENEIETFSEQELKSKQKGSRAKKKPRGSSPTSSDEEFSIKVPKRQCTKNKIDNNQCVINLEQELKECIGVASRKSQRKCTSGKQNVLVEYWSSDDSNLGIEDSEAVLNIYNSNTETTSFTDINNLSLQSSSPDNIEDTNGNSNSTIEVDNKKEETCLPIRKSTTEVEKIKPVKHKSGPNKTKRSSKPEKKLQKLNVDLENNGQTIASTRKKRNAVDTLYYWSSSSEDEFQDIIEIKSPREEYEDEDRPLQHGWIVGDSPKKLVTMLAQAKGKKLEVESVKKNKKKRIGV